MLGMAGAAATVVTLFATCDAAVRWVGWPVPGSLAALLLLFAFCVVRGAVPAGLDRLCRAALPWLPLYFVPACALALLDLARFGDALVVIGLSITAGTVVAGAVTARVARSRERRAPAETGVKHQR